MISYLRGIYQYQEDDKAILDVNGVGYGIFMPLSHLSNLGLPGTEVTVYTYLSVREDAMQLFGFLSKDDLSVFKLILGVSGIGPKSALGVLSVMNADELRFAVLSDDVKTISSAPGIGKKTAQKLILELKDKLSLEDALEHSLAKQSLAAPAVTSEISEAIMALQALGYRGTDAMQAVNSIPDAGTLSTEALIRQALLNITT